MKPRLGDSEQDGSLLLGGPGAEKDGGGGRVGIGGRPFRPRKSSVLTFGSSPSNFSRTRDRGIGRDFRNEK